jgi:hypothetical protein
MRRAPLLVLVLALAAACNNVLGIPEVSHHLDGGSKADGGLVCAQGKKDCAGVCVSANDPATGCGGASCDPCSSAHARVTCANGACALGSCDDGFADCNHTPGDGCEIDLTSDPKNCGRCDGACAGTLKCASSLCVCVDAADCTNGGTCAAPVCVCNGTTCGAAVACNGAGNCGT